MTDVETACQALLQMLGDDDDDEVEQRQSKSLAAFIPSTIDEVRMSPSQEARNARFMGSSLQKRRLLIGEIVGKSLFRNAGAMAAFLGEKKSQPGMSMVAEELYDRFVVGVKNWDKRLAAQTAASAAAALTVPAAPSPKPRAKAVRSARKARSARGPKSPRFDAEIEYCMMTMGGPHVPSKENTMVCARCGLFISGSAQASNESKGKVAEDVADSYEQDFDLDEGDIEDIEYCMMTMGAPHVPSESNPAQCARCGQPIPKKKKKKGEEEQVASFSADSARGATKTGPILFSSGGIEIRSSSAAMELHQQWIKAEKEQKFKAESERRERIRTKKQMRVEQRRRREKEMDAMINETVVADVKDVAENEAKENGAEENAVAAETATKASSESEAIDAAAEESERKAEPARRGRGTREARPAGAAPQFLRKSSIKPGLLRDDSSVSLFGANDRPRRRRGRSRVGSVSEEDSSEADMCFAKIIEIFDEDDNGHVSWIEFKRLLELKPPHKASTLTKLRGLPQWYTRVISGVSKKDKIADYIISMIDSADDGDKRYDHVEFGEFMEMIFEAAYNKLRGSEDGVRPTAFAEFLELMVFSIPDQKMVDEILSRVEGWTGRKGNDTYINLVVFIDCIVRELEYTIHATTAAGSKFTIIKCLRFLALYIEGDEISANLKAIERKRTHGQVQPATLEVRDAFPDDGRVKRMKKIFFLAVRRKAVLKDGKLKAALGLRDKSRRRIHSVQADQNFSVAKTKFNTLIHRPLASLMQEMLRGLFSSIESSKSPSERKGGATIKEFQLVMDSMFAQAFRAIKTEEPGTISAASVSNLISCYVSTNMKISSRLEKARTVTKFENKFNKAKGGRVTGKSFCRGLIAMFKTLLEAAETSDQKRALLSSLLVFVCAMICDRSFATFCTSGTLG